MPLRPRTTGASTWNRVPSGSSRMRSTICWGSAVDDRAVLRAVGHADAGVEQAQVVVDLGDRPDRRAGVAGGALLVDRDGGRQALDEVDVGLVHLAQELPGVGRQRLHVPALALGVDGVEGEGRLARARQAREHDQPVARQLQGDVLEVVLTSTADHQLIGHGRSYRRHPTRTRVCPRDFSRGPGSGRRGRGRVLEPTSSS